VTDDYCVFGVFGPKSRLLMQKLSADDFSKEKFKFATSKYIQINEKKIWAQRLSYVGELGYELYIKTSEAKNIYEKIIEEVKIKINNISDKAIFGDLVDGGLSGMLHYKEISYDENIENLKKFKKNEILNVKIIEIKDDKIKFSKRALDKDPFDWFKDNNKKVGDIITTRIHEVLKTGVKVSIDKDKKLIVTIRKADLAKETADQRPEVFSKDNALDSKIIELDLKNRKIKLSVKAAQIDEEKSLIAKFGEGATKSGATLKGIFEKAIGKKGKKEK
jgi:ribosomal protein S1